MSANPTPAAARNAVMDAEPTAVTTGPKRRCHYRPSKALVNEWRYVAPTP